MVKLLYSCRYWELKKKKQKKGKTEEDVDFPGHEKIKFGEVVEAPPKLVVVPKVGLRFYYFTTTMKRKVLVPTKPVLPFFRHQRMSMMLRKKGFVYRLLRLTGIGRDGPQDRGSTFLPL